MGHLGITACAVLEPDKEVSDYIKNVAEILTIGLGGMF